MTQRLYIHQQPDWPNFRWDEERLGDMLASVRRQHTRLFEGVQDLGFEWRQQASLDTLTEDVLKTSEIEGEILERVQVRSSVARRLNIDIGGVKPDNANVEGIVELLLDATGNYAEPLAADRLFEWHARLFPTGRSGWRRITIAGWRDDSDGPMQVISGPMGREKVHFEAPPASSLDWEMQTFLKWFNAPAETDLMLNAGMAHLWFVTIHPFDDGNGRIARAIADMLLARADDRRQRFYSMSSQIRREMSSKAPRTYPDYYRILEETQKGTMDITRWQEWFLACLGRSIEYAQQNLSAALAKERFWEQVSSSTVNERQRKIINLLLDGFEGKLTVSKWARIAKCHQDTAERDIADLIERSVLAVSSSGSRTPSYHLAGQRTTVATLTDSLSPT